MNNDDRKLDANHGSNADSPRAVPEAKDRGVIVAGAAARAAAGHHESNADAPCADPEAKDPGVIVAGAAARAAAGPGVQPAPGAVAGAPAETGAAEAVDPNRERAYWRENFSGRDYVEKGSSFDDYGPAYGLGVHSRVLYPGRDFADVESELSGNWAASREGSTLSWEQAKHAVRDAWNRISPSS